MRNRNPSFLKKGKVDPKELLKSREEILKGKKEYNRNKAAVKEQTKSYLRGLLLEEHRITLNKLQEIETKYPEFQRIRSILKESAHKDASKIIENSIKELFQSRKGRTIEIVDRKEYEAILEKLKNLKKENSLYLKQGVIPNKYTKGAKILMQLTSAGLTITIAGVAGYRATIVNIRYKALTKEYKEAYERVFLEKLDKQFAKYASLMPEEELAKTCVNLNLNLAHIETQKILKEKGIPFEAEEIGKITMEQLSKEGKLNVRSLIKETTQDISNRYGAPAKEISRQLMSDLSNPIILLGLFSALALKYGYNKLIKNKR